MNVTKQIKIALIIIGAYLISNYNCPINHYSNQHNCKCNNYPNMTSSYLMEASPHRGYKFLFANEAIRAPKTNTKCN